MKITVKVVGASLAFAVFLAACGKDHKDGAEKGTKGQGPATSGVAAKQTPEQAKAQAEDSLTAASATILQAKETGANVEPAEVSLRDAKQAYEHKTYDKATLLATQAQQQAAQAHNQMQMDKAKALILVAQKTRDRLSGDDQVLLRDAETAYDAGQGEIALRNITSLMSKNTVAMQSGKVERYVVQVGDSLWIISAKPEIYNDPYQWPLIYKANTDRIKDPDRVLPGWKLVIKHDYTKEEIRAAIAHARRRGPWLLGKLEESDAKFLGMIVEDHQLAGTLPKRNVAAADSVAKPHVTPAPRVTESEVKKPHSEPPASHESAPQGGFQELPPPVGL